MSRDHLTNIKPLTTRDAAAAFVDDPKFDRTGITAMAKALGVSRSAVYKWGDWVPELRVYQIEAIMAANGKTIRRR